MADGTDADLNPQNESDAPLTPAAADDAAPDAANDAPDLAEAETEAVIEAVEALPAATSTAVPPQWSEALEARRQAPRSP